MHSPSVGDCGFGNRLFICTSVIRYEAVVNADIGAHFLQSLTLQDNYTKPRDGVLRGTHGYTFHQP